MQDRARQRCPSRQAGIDESRLPDRCASSASDNAIDATPAAIHCTGPVDLNQLLMLRRQMTYREATAARVVRETSQNSPVVVGGLA